jgi:prepilin-type N-terminal cleavage/methylation domain-containing protein
MDNNSQKSFTLIELLVVIAIVGILAGIIIVSMSGATDKAKIAKLQVYSNSLRDSLGANLVSEWKLDEINNPSTNQTPDTWGGNTGTLGDGTTASTLPALESESNCAIGKCLSFNGTTNYLNVGTANLSFGDSVSDKPFTLAAWVNMKARSNFEIINKANEYRWINNNLFRLYLFDENGSNYIYRNAIDLLPYQNQWIYLVATYDGSKVVTGIKLYINGSETTFYGTGSAGTYTAMHNTGGILRVGTTTTNGLIDEVRIYSTNIPSAVIKQQYFAGLKQLFAKNIITKQEYNQRLAIYE